ncbi:hypothetical protein BDV96DRAFT_597642 [Lophiotrema nucula]|uniref:SWIM-type domain-containing protein n=1 Tax=Lophiotrema nucula TaxID=690887 RepID=A0A6A5ZF80_9PLEO|nr:hypothetical protein BDV96DRAFT_597642 [Lophiotrema nucula]
MARKKAIVAVAEAEQEVPEVAPRRSGRKRMEISYKEPKETEIEWVEPPTKKSKKVEKVTKKVKATVVSSDDAADGNDKEMEDDEVEITSVVTKKKAEKKKPAPKPAPKLKSRKKASGIQYDEDGNEVRQRDYEDTPSTKFLAAKDRAETQAIHFVDRERCDTEISPEEKFTISGTSGSNYTVHIKHIPKCNCMDSIMRGRQYHCKHIIYVYVNVLRVRDDLAYQMALTSDELNEIFNSAPAAPTDRVIIQIEDDPNRKPIEGECPICYMEFEPEKERITYCKNSCGNNVHTECINIWIQTKQREHKTATCPYCRERWVSG